MSEQVRKFRKTAVIEAVRFLRQPQMPKAFRDAVCRQPHFGMADPPRPHIHSLEGPHYITIGDWIIKGVRGEFYACKSDIFAATYEPAAPEEPHQTVSNDHEVPPLKCADCADCAKRAYSDGATPGFFYGKCEKHRQSEPQPVSAEPERCVDGTRYHVYLNDRCISCGYVRAQSEPQPVRAEPQLVGYIAEIPQPPKPLTHNELWGAEPERRRHTSWSEYKTRKIAELEAENAGLRESREEHARLLGMARHQLKIRPSKFSGQWALDADAALTNAAPEKKE